MAIYKMDKKEILKRLLSYGLFPERLTGILNSEKFGIWALKNIKNTNLKDTYKLLTYKLTRNNNSPRFLSIPHPLGYFTLSYVINQNWREIETRLHLVTDSVNISMIAPKLSNNNKRLFSMASYDQHQEKEKLQLKKQFGKKYFVQADISDFYSSIYTHAISWALIGKELSKQQIRQKNWYNDLDTSIRNIQDRESKGVPIGPDTSAIIAELLLSKIDQKLEEYDYIRFIDDYKCFCETKEQADRFIKDLSFCLENFRLKLNAKKTKILDLPQALTHDWVRKLKQSIDWEKIVKGSKDKILGFLDLSTELFRKNPEESSIRYAAKVLTKKKYEDYLTYTMILRYFLSLCFLFPYVIDICDEFASIGINTFNSHINEIKEILLHALTKMLDEHVSYHRSDVITWCLFLAIKYEIKLVNYEKIACSILKTKDCIPNLLVYLYAKVNKKNINKFLGLMKNVDLSEWWLFVYEISRIENLELKDRIMEKMRTQNVSFLVDEILKKL
jgi:hypothetical protein